MNPGSAPGPGASAQDVTAGRDVIAVAVAGDYHAGQAPEVDALHQLPPPPGDFVGREDELRELNEHIAAGGVTISGVRGMGGIGKTVLALVLAERLKDHYPDAQFFLNLQGTEQDKMLSPAEALAHVVRGYHLTAKLPDGEAELRGLYLSLLHGKRVLLLMDNAAGAAQVEPLIPPTGCALLVTSRQRFTLPGLFARDLDTLPADKARDLLLAIAARIGDAADRLAELCGYLPLALRVAASALAVQQDLSPDEYIGRLGDERSRLKHLSPVEASIQLSEQLLGNDLRRRWHALAVFPRDFDRPAAAAVWKLDDDDAQQTLSALLAYSLLGWNDKSRRYYLHDLVRLYVDGRLAKPERAAAQLRHAEHFCAVAAAANGLYLKGGDNVLRGLALFDQEWSNIQAGFIGASAHAAEDDVAASLCNQYPECREVLPQPPPAPA